MSVATHETTERTARPRPLDEASGRAWDIAAQVVDPELPVLTIEDLGILRGARVDGDTVHIMITPTYSGCPAMDAIGADVRAALGRAGYRDVQIEFVLSPAWTSDWMSEAGKEKLAAFGIAPPTGHSAAGRISVRMSVKCPHCDSLDTREVSRFGSTSCKALYVCRACQEPFDYFKVL